MQQMPIKFIEMALSDLSLTGLLVGMERFSLAMGASLFLLSTSSAFAQVLKQRSGSTEQGIPNCIDPPGASVGTATNYFIYFGPTYEFYVDTAEIVGPTTVQRPAQGFCTASCSIGPMGSCPVGTLPTFSNCQIPQTSCILLAGQSLLLTTLIEQDLIIFTSGFEQDSNIFANGFEN
jgi:hypothetical protein